MNPAKQYPPLPVHPRLTLLRLWEKPLPPEPDTRTNSTTDTRPTHTRAFTPMHTQADAHTHTYIDTHAPALRPRALRLPLPRARSLSRMYPPQLAARKRARTRPRASLYDTDKTEICQTRHDTHGLEVSPQLGRGFSSRRARRSSAGPDGACWPAVGSSSVTKWRGGNG